MITSDPLTTNAGEVFTMCPECAALGQPVHNGRPNNQGHAYLEFDPEHVDIDPRQEEIIANEEEPATEQPAPNQLGELESRVTSIESRLLIIEQLLEGLPARILAAAGSLSPTPA